jgi:hypothetical protein
MLYGVVAGLNWNDEPVSLNWIVAPPVGGPPGELEKFRLNWAWLVMGLAMVDSANPVRAATSAFMFFIYFFVFDLFGGSDWPLFPASFFAEFPPARQMRTRGSHQTETTGRGHRPHTKTRTKWVPAK